MPNAVAHLIFPMHIALESPDQPEVIDLIADLDAYQDTLYPNYADDPLSVFLQKCIESQAKCDPPIVLFPPVSRAAEQRWHRGPDTNDSQSRSLPCAGGRNRES